MTETPSVTPADVTAAQDAAAAAQAASEVAAAAAAEAARVAAAAAVQAQAVLEAERLEEARAARYQPVGLVLACVDCGLAVTDADVHDSIFHTGRLDPRQRREQARATRREPGSIRGLHSPRLEE